MHGIFARGALVAPRAKPDSEQTAPADIRSDARETMETNSSTAAAAGVAQSTSVTCPNCGGKVEFDIKSRKFICTSCRTVIDVRPPKQTVDEYSINDYNIREKTNTPLSGVSVATCRNCGGEIYFDANETAKQCPMCGSSQIRVGVATSGVAPEGIVPFRIDAQDAQQKFRLWIKGRWFAPGLLKKAYAEGKLEGLYVPYWTYDAETCADYTGQGGRTRTVRDRDGNTRTVTDWYPVAGRVYQNFDDLLVCASAKNSGSVITTVEPYNTVSDIAPFTFEYLSGYKAERYSIDGLTCFRTAQQQMEDALRADAQSDILMKGFDQAMIHSFQPMYRNVTYKGVLLPMYTASYSYQGKIYSYAVNGQTGRVGGSYPKSVIKIVAAVLAALLVLFGLMYAFGAFEDDGGSYDSGYSSYSSYGDYGGSYWSQAVPAPAALAGTALSGDPTAGTAAAPAAQATSQQYGG